MVITATEFKANFGKYLRLADTEDIFISSNNKTVARLTNARDARMAAWDKLRGVLKGSEVSRETIREERLAKHHETAD
jgi:prevent-host-death family protein